MLDVSHLTFSYGKATLLSDLSFHLAPGECLVVIGANGSGKSTLLSLLSGALKPGQGTIQCRGRIGLVPQQNGIFEDLTVRENLKFFSNLARRPMPNPLPMGLEPYAAKKASALSGGYQKRLGIACTMVSRPELWLFDEPCAGLDILWRDELIRLICALKNAGNSLIYVGHDPAEFVPFYDSILTLSGGTGTITKKENISMGNETQLIRQLLSAPIET